MPLTGLKKKEYDKKRKERRQDAANIASAATPEERAAVVKRIKARERKRKQRAKKRALQTPATPATQPTQTSQAHMKEGDVDEYDFSNLSEKDRLELLQKVGMVNEASFHTTNARWKNLWAIVEEETRIKTGIADEECRKKEAIVRARLRQDKVEKNRQMKELFIIAGATPRQP